VPINATRLYTCAHKKGQGDDSNDGKHLSVFLRIMSYRSGMTPTCASCRRRALDVAGGTPATPLPPLARNSLTRLPRLNVATLTIGNIQPDIREAQLQGSEVLFIPSRVRQTVRPSDDQLRVSRKNLHRNYKHHCGLHRWVATTDGVRDAGAKEMKNS
jgi:hypothetical protein